MKKIILTGGGTAGHVTPNLALLPALREEDFEIHYIGSYNGIERRLIEAASIPYDGISSGKLRRYFDLKNFSDPLRVLKGYFEARKLMKKYKPDIVFSKGGFVAVPVVLAAKHYKVPVIIHESDMTPGLANRLCIPVAKKVCCNFPETLAMLPKDKAVLSGSPIREELANGNKADGLSFCGFNTSKPVIMVIGGSLGANSINIGRLAPQVVYYVNAYAELVAQGAIHEDEAFNVVVPTGNFGNILAAYYAKKMGIPIGKLICASNQNNVLTDFFRNGTYDMNRPFYTTISPSMDILESSNFERFLYYISGEDSERTAQWMKDLKSTGKLSVNEEEFKRVQANFSGAYVNDEETKAIIEQVYNSYGYLMDPHTAVAMGAYMKELEAHPEDGARHTIIASTAHPFKFPTPICEALDIKVGSTPYESLDNISAVTGVAFPKQLAALKAKSLRFTKAIDKENMKQEILDFVDTFSK